MKFVVCRISEMKCRWRYGMDSPTDSPSVSVCSSLLFARRLSVFCVCLSRMLSFVLKGIPSYQQRIVFLLFASLLLTVCVCTARFSSCCVCVCVVPLPSVPVASSCGLTLSRARLCVFSISLVCWFSFGLYERVFCFWQFSSYAHYPIILCIFVQVADTRRLHRPRCRAPALALVVLLLGLVLLSCIVVASGTGDIAAGGGQRKWWALPFDWFDQSASVMAAPPPLPGEDDPNRPPQPPLTIHLIPHSHTDPGWTSTYAQYYHSSVKSILDGVTQSLVQSPTRKFVWSEISFFQRWYESLPDYTTSGGDGRTKPQPQDLIHKYTVKELVANGQLEFVGGGYVMPDESLATLEAVVDSYTYGHGWLTKTFGGDGSGGASGVPYKTPRVGWSIDPFGASSSIALDVLPRIHGLQWLVLNRVPHDLKSHWIADQSMEHVWTSSSSGSSGQGRPTSMPVHVLYNHYSSPSGLDLDFGHSAPAFQSDLLKQPVDYNPSQYKRLQRLAADLVQFARRQSVVYPLSKPAVMTTPAAPIKPADETDIEASEADQPLPPKPVPGTFIGPATDAMILMGDDFRYTSAGHEISSLEIIAAYINQMKELREKAVAPLEPKYDDESKPFAGVTVQLSTPSEYLQAAVRTRLKIGPLPPLPQVYQKNGGYLRDGSATRDWIEAAASLPVRSAPPASSSSSSETGSRERELIPYSNNRWSYWTGFYSSYGWHKGLFRRAEQLVSTAEQLMGVYALAHRRRIADRTNPYAAVTNPTPFDRYEQKLDAAKKHSLLLAHHDAITGTSAPQVMGDYAVSAVIAINLAQWIISDILSDGFATAAANVSFLAPTELDRAAITHHRALEYTEPLSVVSDWRTVGSSIANTLGVRSTKLSTLQSTPYNDHTAIDLGSFCHCRFPRLCKLS